jgi:hypothetical protein
MVSKKAAQNIHTKRRALERFGVELNKKDIRQIVSDIQKQKDTVSFVKTISNRVSVWEVSILENKALALYDKKRKNLVTLLLTSYEV